MLKLDFNISVMTNIANITLLIGTSFRFVSEVYLSVPDKFEKSFMEGYSVLC